MNEKMKYADHDCQNCGCYQNLSTQECICKWLDVVIEPGFKCEWKDKGYTWNPDDYDS